MSTRLPPLEPIWMERNVMLGDSLRPMLGMGFPSWEQMSREAEALQSQIAKGLVAWPPPWFEFIHFFATTHMGDSAPVAPEFRLLNVFQAECLPSVKHYLDVTVQFYIDNTPFRYSDPDKQLRRPILFNNFAVRAWEHFGKQVYVVDPATYDLLINTDLPSMPSEALRVPLPVFYLKFPSNSFYFIDPDTKCRQEAEGALVIFEKTTGDDGYGRSLTVLVMGRAEPGQIDGFLYSYVFLSPQTPINEIRLRGLERIMAEQGRKEIVHDVPHAILAICLYLMSEHPVLTPVPPARRDVAAVRNPAKRRKIEKRNAKLSKLGYIYLGGEERIVAPAAERTPSKGRKLERPTWVRGHWRHQAYGPKLALRKLIWIRPHLRGPDLSESVSIRAQKVQPATKR